RALCRFRTLSAPFLAVWQSDLPTSVESRDSSRAPSLSPGCPGDADGTMRPADFLPGRPRLRLGLLRSPSHGPPGTRQELPACDVNPSQRAPPHTPAPVAWFPCPLIPTPSQPSQGDDTVGRCIFVLRGEFGFTGVAARCFAFAVHGPLSL